MGKNSFNIPTSKVNRSLGIYGQILLNTSNAFQSSISNEILRISISNKYCIIKSELFSKENIKDIIFFYLNIFLLCSSHNTRIRQKA